VNEVRSGGKGGSERRIHQSFGAGEAEKGQERDIRNGNCTRGNSLKGKGEKGSAATPLVGVPFVRGCEKGGGGGEKYRRQYLRSNWFSQPSLSPWGLRVPE